VDKEISSTALRPKRSENEPMMGQPTNWPIKAEQQSKQRRLARNRRVRCDHRDVVLQDHRVKMVIIRL